LTVDGLRGKKESHIVHGGGTSSISDLSTESAAAKGALYRETLQAPGNNHPGFLIATREFAPISVQANSDASALIPLESALLSRASQPTMASATGHGKPELSTLLESGTFYFALTLCGTGILSDRLPA
jgi:hypothetical protein